MFPWGSNFSRPRWWLAHEEAERVSGRVCEDIERLGGVIASVKYQRGSEAQSPFVVLGQFIVVAHGEIDMKLHRNSGFWPRRGRELANLLERHAWLSGGID